MLSDVQNQKPKGGAGAWAHVLKFRTPHALRLTPWVHVQDNSIPTAQHLPICSMSMNSALFGLNFNYSEGAR